MALLGLRAPKAPVACHLGWAGGLSLSPAVDSVFGPGRQRGHSRLDIADCIERFDLRRNCRRWPAEGRIASSGVLRWGRGRGDRGQSDSVGALQPGLDAAMGHGWEGHGQHWHAAEDGSPDDLRWGRGRAGRGQLCSPVSGSV